MNEKNYLGDMFIGVKTKKIIKRSSELDFSQDIIPYWFLGLFTWVLFIRFYPWRSTVYMISSCCGSSKFYMLLIYVIFVIATNYILGQGLKIRQRLCDAQLTRSPQNSRDIQKLQRLRAFTSRRWTLDSCGWEYFDTKNMIKAKW